MTLMSHFSSPAPDPDNQVYILLESLSTNVSRRPAADQGMMSLRHTKIMYALINDCSDQQEA